MSYDPTLDEIGPVVPATAAVAPGDEQRPWHEFRDEGLLWLVNRTVFHPRGYALAMGRNDDGTSSGWCLIGDGTEPWRFDPTPPTDRQRRLLGAQSEDQLFARVKALMP